MLGNGFSSSIRSQLELHIGITCACLPCLRPVLAIIFPWLFGKPSDYAQPNDQPTFGDPNRGQKRAPFSSGMASIAAVELAAAYPHGDGDSKLPDNSQGESTSIMTETSQNSDVSV